MSRPAEVLDREAEALRQAVDRADFDGASAAVERYVQLLTAALPQMPRTTAAEQVRSAGERIEWARRNICAARARLGEKFRGLECALRYRSPAPDAVHTWRMDG
jgi:hypothetical protein